MEEQFNESFFSKNYNLSITSSNRNYDDRPIAPSEKYDYREIASLMTLSVCHQMNTVWVRGIPPEWAIENAEAETV